jgi:hypothetical protein
MLRTGSACAGPRTVDCVARTGGRRQIAYGPFTHQLMSLGPPGAIALT